jgi:hypothetical protein
MSGTESFGVEATANAKRGNNARAGDDDAIRAGGRYWVRKQQARLKFELRFRK